MNKKDVLKNELFDVTNYVKIVQCRVAIQRNVR